MIDATRSNNGYAVNGKVPAILNNPTNTIPAIRSELQKIEKINAKLSQAIAELETRLGFIMREPEPTNRMPSDVPPRQAVSPLIAALAGCSRESGESVRRISSILRRLDI